MKKNELFFCFSNANDFNQASLSQTKFSTFQKHTSFPQVNLIKEILYQWTFLSRLIDIFDSAAKMSSSLKFNVCSCKMQDPV